MGLFDHLFKTKSPPSEEKADEHALEGAAAARSGEGAPRTPLPHRPDPSAFLHPKNFVPRGAPGLTPAPRPSSASSGKSSERRTSSAGSSPAADEIVLTLGDVLSRIPTHYLKAGAHDAKRELRFKIHDLSSDIARGRAAVPLSRIAQLAPEIFVKHISRDEDTEVRLPLQKLVEQIGLLRSQPKSAVFEKMAHPIAATELAPSAKSVLSMAARHAEPIDVSSVVEPLAPAAGPSPIILAEAGASQKAFELKPAAEHAAAPVILGPSPAIETPAVTLAPAVPHPPEPKPAPVIAATTGADGGSPISGPPRFPSATSAASLPSPEPAPAPVIAEARQTAEPTKPAAAIPAPPAVPAPTIPDRDKIIINWAGDAPAKGDALGEESVQAVVAEPGRIEPAADAPRLAPLESPPVDPKEESIQLSLAAILRTCPAEIVVGRLPQVDDGVRISLPFAPIDRQLIKGQVEVSALRFITALPETYQKYFVAKVGVKVPIPLEEVFQNLPTPSHELIPAPPVPPPVVLAPAGAAPAGVPVEEEQEPALPAAPGELPKIDVPPLSVASSPEEPAHPLPPAAVEPPPIPSAAASVTPETPLAGQPEVGPPPSAEPSGPELAFDAGSEPPAVPPVAPLEAEAAMPVAEVAPSPTAISPAPEESLSAASGESPKLTFHPPIFRPHFVPPPPIFGFTSTSASPSLAPDSQTEAKAEPPSVLAGFTEAETPAPASASGNISLEPSAAVAPEAAPEAGSAAEPTADLMAFAGEHAAPDLVQFSSEPVPFADLAETLAHETTYAPDLAEVVHIPDAESDESKAPVSEEHPPAPATEHRAVPIVEGLAAAAVTATLAEHVPLDFREIIPPAAEPEASGETAAPAETPELEKPGTGEPLIPDQPAPAAETAPPLAETIAELEKAEPMPETPEVPASEPPAAVIPLPPPLPLVPPPRLHVESAHVEPAHLEPTHLEPAHLEVLPPPALSLRRFDQDAVQALFMTEEALDLPKISRLAASLPGVYACVIATRDQACTGGTLPEGFDLAALLGLAPRVGEAAGRMPIGQLKHFTLYGDAYSVSFFERHGLSLCAVHRPRSFVPGVREKLVALADELSR